jgi:hypothetical protein
MAEKLRLFVSATADLEAERAIVGRVLADLPVQVGVEIRRTPVSGAKYDDIYEAIANCDRVYFLLGQDITAPSGAEWHTAWQLERSVLPLRTRARLTPAAREFVFNSLVQWQTFNSSAHLASIITLDLIRILDHPTNRYGLTVAELELLNVYGKRIRQRAEQQAEGMVKEPGGAEGGGVLLDTLRQEPTEGVAVEEEWY